MSLDNDARDGEQSTRTRVEMLRQAVSELAAEMRLKVIDNLDDPGDSWIQIRTPWFKLSEDKQRQVRHERQVRLTIDVEDGVPGDDQVERLKAELRQRLHDLRSFRAKKVAS